MTESEEDFNAQHSGLDRSELLDYGYLQQVAQLNLVVAANLAGAPPPPAIPTIAPMADPGAYILTWFPDQRAAGYAISFRPAGLAEFAPFFYVSAAESGNVALTELDPQQTYAVSLAALDTSGRLSSFSPEVFIGPPQ
jgi:hypothetical protein